MFLHNAYQFSSNPITLTVNQVSLLSSTSTAAISTVCWFVKRAFQYVTHYGSANQEFADASVRRYEQKGVLRAGVPSSSPQSPPLFPFLPTPYPFRRLLRRLPISHLPETVSSSVPGVCKNRRYKLVASRNVCPKNFHALFYNSTYYSIALFSITI